ncbi:DUF2076 family protein [Rhodoferax sp. WC2427]|uniref:DUF2076 family protein n=1 Tax=Rhodoferax sp. WC2427 TaxID=3234144 RepID=UPI003464F50C
MNIPEREQLSRFLLQLAQAQAGAKDPQAQALIAEAVARQPDAAYLLVQRCLLQDNALQTAQAQIARLQAEAQQAQPAGNFLDANGWGRAPVAPVAAYAPAPAYPQAMPVAAPAAPSRFQAPSFLTSMATTAAGVAAGAFLFQGIESLMGQHGSKAAALASETPASAFGLSEPTAAAPAAAPAAAQPLADDTTDVFGNDDGLDIGGDSGGDSSSDWA